MRNATDWAAVRQPFFGSEPEFAERLRKRDAGAFGQVVTAYYSQLLRAARARGFSREHCYDLTQSVFTALLEGAHRFEGRSHIRTFLFGIFYNKVHEALRRKTREGDSVAFDITAEWWSPRQKSWMKNPEERLLTQELRQSILACLKVLPQKQRAVFYLRVVRERGFPEICEKLGITTSHAGVLFFRARQRLRKALERKGIQRL